ncbi:MAG: alpha/beta hydrolase [Rhodocyclaceae bacterium]|nr:alpha/beta hydrolase [Rhodocyclaceae bacterium]
MSIRTVLARFLSPSAKAAAGQQPRRNSVLCASPKGLHRMAYLEWGDPASDRVLVCVHGLTRNAHDFDFIARALADDYRVVCPDVVGRGGSDWLADKARYAVPQYVADMVTLIARLAVERVDWIGTSMGGLIGMTLAAQEKTPIRRLVLNDVGPVLAAAALQRIGTYVGRDFRFADLAAAESHLRKAHAPFGALSDAQWQHLTVHSFRRDGDGYVFAYDPGIGDAFRNAPVLMDVDVWPLYDRIACPTLVLRGAESDLLSRETLVHMSLRGPCATTIEVEGVGHAPALMEESQVAPIRDFLGAP